MPLPYNTHAKGCSNALPRADDIPCPRHLLRLAKCVYVCANSCLPSPYDIHAKSCSDALHCDVIQGWPHTATGDDSLAAGRQARHLTGYGWHVIRHKHHLQQVCDGLEQIFTRNQLLCTNTTQVVLLPHHAYAELHAYKHNCGNC